MTREQILARLMIEPETGCLLWSGKLNAGGYGTASFDGRKRLVHRLMYEWFAGPVPEGLELDHLCRVTRCAAPAHLEAVTHQENMRRGRNWNAEKTHCPHGHPYDEANTRLVPRGRECRACLRAKDRSAYMREYVRRVGRKPPVSKPACGCDDCRVARARRYGAYKARQRRKAEVDASPDGRVAKAATG